ncbi:hypothetical protein GGS23DRAFT_601630 [Durotheca rogersii]|uniref:uncharacterized protein n=1 Tax=Durotheca rogersii TaxID=419775 RepID=UPI00221EA620|nr:uncharacterized protein GGS23DRAFT_601630 [Durotheca rogersii]KAI5854088.1 hypothetical protein GGS23DRAFT_601630 [Durotheca rogersii]
MASLASSKRKHSIRNSSGSDARLPKRSKGGGGRWQTPHHKAKLQALKTKGLEVGDMGIWTTCVKGKEQQALEELTALCGEYVESLYGIKYANPAEALEDGEEDNDLDIESSIKKEVLGMGARDAPKDSTLEPMRTDLDCLLFMKTRPPINPVKLVQQICRDAQGVKDKGDRRSRFINRFTPITLTAKATEIGLEEVASKVLGEHFQLANMDNKQTQHGDLTTGLEACSYAIRPTFRAHNNLSRDQVIEKVASLISPSHKVNLSSPDKVILIDIYQTFCGMSVVDSDWDVLKRYNLHEIYLSASKPASDAPQQPNI